MESRKTIRKWFFVWEFEKEEDWLNEMAMNGWVLESVGFCSYHFRKENRYHHKKHLRHHHNDESPCGKCYQK